MLPLLIAAVLGQYGSCGTHATYGFTYARAAYAAPAAVYHAPVQSYQAPAYNASLVGDYMKQESAYQATVQQNAKLDALIALMGKQTPAPQSPAPQYQAPYQPVQVPSKASPQSPSPQYPPPVFQAPPAPDKNSPSAFGGVQPPPLATPPQAGGDISAVSQILQNRCAACHAAPAAKGAGIVLLDPNGNLAPMSAALMLAIQEDIKTGKMPKGGPQLPDNELAEVSGWVGDHSAEVAAFLAQGLGR